MTDENSIYYTQGLPVPETPETGEKPAFWKDTDIVGKREPRVDAYERLSGTAVYPADLNLPNMIYGAIRRCPYPHAKVTRVDTTKARNMPGVRAIVTGDSPEARGLKWSYQDYEGPLFDSHCRFEGEIVAAVAADTLMWFNSPGHLVKV
ncbi:MAG: hypothetical protein ACP5FP_03440 [Desulfuromonadaceae bacterium]